MKNNSMRVFNIDPRKIDVMEGFNQRKDFGDISELAAQIKEQGLLEPITVMPYMKDGEERYLLVNGERRYRALNQLIEDGEDVGTISANFLEDTNISDNDLYIQQYMRNEGKKFNDVEFGRLCKRLKDGGLSNTEIGKKLGKNPGVITYALQSLDYDPRIREMIENGEIGGTEVRRMYTAARKQYGDEWEVKANEMILQMKSVQAAKTEDGKKPKVSIKDNDLYGDVKDTKTFLAGMKVLKQYLRFYQSSNKNLDIEFDIIDMDERLNKNGTLTLRALFEEAVKNASEAKQTA